MVHVFKYKDTDFYYNESGNIKQIYANDKLVCEVKTFRLYAKFYFVFKGVHIEVKAISVLNGKYNNPLDGYDFEFVANGNILREAKSLFKQLPNLLFYMASLIVIASFGVYREVSDTNPDAWYLLPIGACIALLSLISGLLLKHYSK